jgi:hypothetical protein
LPIQIVDFPIKDGDFPYKSPFSHGFPIKNGDFSWVPRRQERFQRLETLFLKAERNGNSFGRRGFTEGDEMAGVVR